MSDTENPADASSAGEFWNVAKGLAISSITAFAAFLVPDAFVPGNASLLRPAAAPFVLVSTLATRAWRRRIRRSLVAAAGVIGLLGMFIIANFSSVEATLGDPPMTRRYIIGYARAPAAAALIAK